MSRGWNQNQSGQIPPLFGRSIADPNDPPPGGLNLKLLLTGEEIKYLFGAEEALLDQLRQQADVDITLSDKGPHERVLCIPGDVETVFKAFSLVCRKLWEFVVSLSDPTNPRMLVLRLAVHFSQVHKIIGNQGATIKDMRDMTGANIKIDQNPLPDSNEKVVEVIGTGESCLQCTYQVCVILQENPPRGKITPYMPKSLIKDVWKPLILAGDIAYIIENGVAIKAPPDVVRKALEQTPIGQLATNLPNSDNPDSGPDYMNPLALLAAISKSSRDAMSGAPPGPEIVKEMMIENEVAGSVIGKGGAKVAEIRQMSGANVSINTEGEVTDTGERMVLIKGTAESVLLAQFLVQSNIDMFQRERGGSMESGFSDFGRGHGGFDKMDEYQERMEIRDYGYHNRGSGGGRPYYHGGNRGGGGQQRGGRRSSLLPWR